MAAPVLPGAAGACIVPGHRQNMLPGSIATLPGMTVEDAFADLQTPTATAWLAGPTRRRPRGVLGDDVGAERLGASAASAAIPCFGLRAEVGPMDVFEDVAPRLADLDGDAAVEIVVVRSHLVFGAQIRDLR